MAAPRTSPRELARALAEGCRTVDQLAARVAVDHDRVKIVLRSMIERGLVKLAGDEFVLTPQGHHARKTRP